MHLRTWMLVGLLALPAFGWADEPAPAARHSFDMHGDHVRQVISNTAASQYGSLEVTATHPASAEPEPKSVTWQQPEPRPEADAPRSLDHFDCDAHECVARDQHHAPLYTVPREYPEFTNYVQTQEDAALACQSSNDMLSTQQRSAGCKVGFLGDQQSFGEDLLDDVVVGTLNALFGGK